MNLKFMVFRIFRLHQVGLIGNWMRQYMPKRDRCWKIGQLSEINNHTVTLDDMQGSFFVLFLGKETSTKISWCIYFICDCGFRFRDIGDVDRFGKVVQ